MPKENIRMDYELIKNLIEPGASVLDLGCGSGDLLQLLIEEKNVIARGIEIDEQAIYSCVGKGLSVFHGDIDSGLSEYRDKSFDYVILNQSLQQIRHFENVFDDALRVGKIVIVGFPNFASCKSRFQLFFGGKTPVTGALPYTWYETPNIRCLSISDFVDYCKKRKIKITHSLYIGEKKRVYIFPNFFASIAIFMITRNGEGKK